MLDKFHSFLKSFFKLKSKLSLGRLILVIPPKLDLVNLLESFLLKEKVKAF